jgi:hypothetical protein
MCGVLASKEQRQYEHIKEGVTFLMMEVKD